MKTHLITIGVIAAGSLIVYAFVQFAKMYPDVFGLLMMIGMVSMVYAMIHLLVKMFTGRN